MEDPLTHYLFRSLLCKPRGLRLKLKVVVVNNWVETFNEEEHPVATIVPHGLFLARPTPTGMRDPLLLGVLNHPHLQVQEPLIEFEVSFALQQSETASKIVMANPDSKQEGASAMRRSCADANHLTDDKFAARKVAVVFKSGIGKILRGSPESEHRPPRRVMHRVQEFSCSRLEDYPTHHTVLAFLQTMLVAYQTSSSTYASSEPTSGYSKLQGPVPPHKSELYQFVGGFIFLGFILSELYCYVVYIDMFLPPPENSSDCGLNEALVKLAHSNLRSMASLVLKALLEPLSDVVTGYISQTQPHLTQDWQNIGQLATEAKTWAQKLLRIAETPPLQIWTYHQPPNLGYKPTRFGKNLWKIIYSILGIPTLANQFFTALADRLNECSGKPTSRKEVQVFMNSTINSRVTDDLEQELPEICLVRNTKSSHVSRFYPGIDTSRKWSILAIFVIRDVKIAILTVPEYVRGQAGPNTKAHVQVFSNDTLSASFLLPTNGLIEMEPLTACLAHFTGRYFVRLQTLGYNKPEELVVIDFAPCLGRTPEPPILVKQEILLISSRKHYILSCTDRFVALMNTDELPEIGGKDKNYKPVLLQLFKFDSTQGFEALATVCCRELFDSLNRERTKNIVYRNGYANSQMRWWKNQRTFYYTNWISPDGGEDSITVFIACIQIAADYGSMKCLASTSLSLKAVLAELDFPDRRPDFQILRTRAKEYLLMDIKDPPCARSMLVQLPSQIHARLVFAVHRNKLHRVSVNGKLAAHFPQYIGTQINYAGYETSHIGLFHQRRVFCSDKVVCAVHRLDYKPI